MNLCEAEIIGCISNVHCFLIRTSLVAGHFSRMSVPLNSCARDTRAHQPSHYTLVQSSSKTQLYWMDRKKHRSSFTVCDRCRISQDRDIRDVAKIRLAYTERLLLAENSILFSGSQSLKGGSSISQSTYAYTLYFPRLCRRT